MSEQSVSEYSKAVLAMKTETQTKCKCTCMKPGDMLTCKMDVVVVKLWEHHSQCTGQGMHGIGLALSLEVMDLRFAKTNTHYRFT